MHTLADLRARGRSCDTLTQKHVHAAAHIRTYYNKNNMLTKGSRPTILKTSYAVRWMIFARGS